MVPSMMMMVAPMIMTPMMLEEVVMAAVVVIVVVVMATMMSVLDHLHQAGLRLNAPGRKGGSRLGCECRRREAREPANHRGNEKYCINLLPAFFQPGVVPWRRS